MKQDDPAQSRAFIEKAREIGADEHNSGADELIRHLANQPKDRPRKTKRRSTR